MNDSYYFAREDKMPIGPVSWEDLVKLFSEGKISSNTLVIRRGDEKWTTLHSIMGEREASRSVDHGNINTQSGLAMSHPHQKKTNGCLVAFLIVAGVGGLLGVLGLGGCFLLVGKAASDASSANQAQIKRAGAEPVSDIQWEEIDKIYNIRSKTTELQKKESWKNYKGKKIQWMGTVSSVGETFGTLQLQVKMNPDTLTSDVLIKLKESSRGDAVKLQEGDSVRFQGVLDDWGSIMPVTIDHGVIIK